MTEPFEIVPPEDTVPQRPPNTFNNEFEFFTEYFSPMFARYPQNPNFVWCGQWWAHPETRTIMRGLWSSWELLHLNTDTGMIQWIRDYAYPMLDRMSSPDGPFKGCDQTKQAHDETKVVDLLHTPRPH